MEGVHEIEGGVVQRQSAVHRTGAAMLESAATQARRQAELIEDLGHR
jgi:hypothetical protein